MSDISHWLTVLRNMFFEEINKKNSWGKNEIAHVFNEAERKVFCKIVEESIQKKD